jgi:hypothetical protein
MGAQSDHFLPQPQNPGTANTDVTWFDTGDGGWPSYQGVLGDLYFDQAVTLFVETAPIGGALRTMNGVGAGQVIAANTPTEVKVEFLGARTKLRLRTGATPPSVWHVNGRVTEGEI